MSDAQTSGFRPASRLAGSETSEILQITFRAAAMARSGVDVITLGAGEPDFDTPDHVKDAAARAMRDGHTKYTPLDGTPALKQAIIAKFERDNALSYATDEVTSAAGGGRVETCL